MIGGKPHVASTVEREALDFLRHQSVLCSKMFKAPASLRVLPYGVSQSATIGSYPHHSLLVAIYTYDIV